jgi:hypothetical protein
MAPPPDWKTPVTRALLWVFAMSWAFDYKADVEGPGVGGSAAQAVFLAFSLVSGFGAMALNHREMLRRPGVWLLLLWWSFLAYAALNAIGHGVPLGRWGRIGLPYLMIGLGLGVAQAAAGRGLSAMSVAAPMVAAGCVNIVWRVFHGFVFKGATLETARMEVFSPAMNPLFAYLGAAIFLAPRFRWVTMAVAAVALGGVLITVTRALLFPMAMAGVLGIVCFGLGLAWGLCHPRQIAGKITLITASAFGALVLLAGVRLAAPTLLERWQQRLFVVPGSGQTSADPSWLTREAEARGMLSILEKEPVHFLCGKGLGASYYWDPSYWPELWTIYPAGTDFSMDIWFNAHSLWTYTVFSTGLIGLLFHLAFFAGAAVNGLVAVRHCTAIGRADGASWLGFLPLFVVCCLLSESFTSNQLAERLTGVMVGLAAGVPQAVLMTARRRGRACAADSPPSAEMFQSPTPAAHAR